MIQIISRLIRIRAICHCLSCDQYKVTTENQCDLQCSVTHVKQKEGIHAPAIDGNAMFLVHLCDLVTELIIKIDLILIIYDHLSCS